MKSSVEACRLDSTCGLCQGSEAYRLEERDRSGRKLEVVVCITCGVVHNHPIPTDEALSRFYSIDYRPSYKGTREPKLRHAARYFSATAAHLAQYWGVYEGVKTVLDVGSGSGEFLYLMKELGKEVRGLEPSGDYAAFCRSRLGLEVETGEIRMFEGRGCYDHVRLSHVVEHLRDPVGSLRRLGGWVAEGGTMYVEVPDFDHYCRTKRPGGMFHYGHIYNFDRESYDWLMAAAGMRVVKRVGPTAAFVVPDAGMGVPGPVGDEVVHAKLALYAEHRSGRLREQSGTIRLLAKLMKRWGEYRIVARERDYASIGKCRASSLKQSLGRI